MQNYDTFPINFRNPDYGLIGKPTFKVDTVQLGDGYTRRIKKGINNRNYTWELTWNNLSEDEVQEIVGFLEGLEGVHPFYWVHPTQGRTYKCHCEDFNVAHDVYDRYNITVTFVEGV